MPTDAVYRYSASAGPKQKTTCSFQPFVERKWNHAFVWVQIPSVGNVTVPEDYYDRFYAYVAQDPPDYSAACKLLVEAVAADTVASEFVGTPGGEAIAGTLREYWWAAGPSRKKVSDACQPISTSSPYPA